MRRRSPEPQLRQPVLVAHQFTQGPRVFPLGPRRIEVANARRGLEIFDDIPLRYVNINIAKVVSICDICYRPKLSRPCGVWEIPPLGKGGGGYSEQDGRLTRVRPHNQQGRVAARQRARKNVWAQRSERVALRRQSVSRSNRRSMRLRCLKSAASEESGCLRVARPGIQGVSARWARAVRHRALASPLAALSPSASGRTDRTGAAPR